MSDSVGHFILSCSCCGVETPRSMSWDEWELLTPDPDQPNFGRFADCEACRSELSCVVRQQVCGQIVYGEPEVRLPGVNMAKGVRTPAQQEAFYGKMIRERKKLAKQVARSLSKKNGHRVEWKASIPRELNTAMVRTSGDKQYFMRDGGKMLKRHGLTVDS